MWNFPVIDPVATGARIKELRIAKQLSVRDISRYMGFEEPQAVYKWQRGEALPTIDNLYALSRLLGTSMDNIVRGKEEDQRSSSLAEYILKYSRKDNNLLIFYVEECKILNMTSYVCDNIHIARLASSGF